MQLMHASMRKNKQTMANTTSGLLVLCSTARTAHACVWTRVRVHCANWFLTLLIVGIPSLQCADLSQAAPTLTDAIDLDRDRDSYAYFVLVSESDTDTVLTVYITYVVQVLYMWVPYYSS